MRDSGHVVVCTCSVKKLLNAKNARALWHTKVPRLQLQNEGAAKKIPSRQTVG